MKLREILEALERQAEVVFGNAYRNYFFGEWQMPWLPDDL